MHLLGGSVGQGAVLWEAWLFGRLRCIHEVVVGVPSTAAGTVAAVAAWVVSRPGRTVAVPAEGHLAAVTGMLAEGKCLSPNLDYGDAVRSLLAGRTWAGAGEWAVGRPEALRARSGR